MASLSNSSFSDLSFSPLLYQPPPSERKRMVAIPRDYAFPPEAPKLNVMALMFSLTQGAASLINSHHP